MLNNDLISRKALIEHLSTILMSDVFPNWANTELKVKCSVGILGERFKREIEAAPTVDAEPVRHSEWVEEKDRVRHWHCQECGLVEGMAHYMMHYCPNCGAKMDKEE